MSNNLEAWSRLLKTKKNIIMEGVPGTGKTHSIDELIETYMDTFHGGDYTLVGANARGAHAMTMHPSSSYEDFIEGLKPNLSQPSCYDRQPIRVRKNIGDLGVATLQFDSGGNLVSVQMNWKQQYSHDMIAVPDDYILPNEFETSPSNRLRYLVSPRPSNLSQAEATEAIRPNASGLIGPAFTGAGLEWNLGFEDSLVPGLLEAPEDINEFLRRFSSDDRSPEEFYIRPLPQNDAIVNFTFILRGQDLGKFATGALIDGTANRRFYSLDIFVQDGLWEAKVNSGEVTQSLVDRMQNLVDNNLVDSMEIPAEVLPDQLYNLTGRPTGKKLGVLFFDQIHELDDNDPIENLLFIENRTQLDRRIAYFYSHDNDCCEYDRLVDNNPDWEIHRLDLNYTFLASNECEENGDDDDEENQPFMIEDGFFLKAIHKAFNEPSKEHFILLDEINRCNVPQVLGDVLTSIEASKRAVREEGVWNLQEATETTLPLSKRQIVVPENLHVIGTMNTTDRSVAPLDAALRRRFAFIRLEPMEVNGNENFPILNQHFSHVLSSFDNLNGLLRQQLGLDATIGHSYVFELERELDDMIRDDMPEHHIIRDARAPIERFWEFSVLPQLADYFDSISYNPLEEISRSYDKGFNTFTFDYAGRGIYFDPPTDKHDRRFSRTIVSKPIRTFHQNGVGHFTANLASTNSNKNPRNVLNDLDEGIEHLFNDTADLPVKVLFIDPNNSFVEITAETDIYISGYMAVRANDNPVWAPTSITNMMNGQSLIFSEPQGGQPNRDDRGRLLFIAEGESATIRFQKSRAGHHIHFKHLLTVTPGEPLQDTQIMLNSNIPFDQDRNLIELSDRIIQELGDDFDQQVAEDLMNQILEEE